MSLKTKNNELFKYEDNDNGDLRFLHDTMDRIDNGLSQFYVATLDGSNNYKIITGLNKTSLNDSYSIRVAIPSDSTGAVSIIVDTVTVQVRKPNGNPVTNFKANGVYNLTYYNSVFILASGGVDDVAFTSDKLLTGYSANDSNGEKVDGTMQERGIVTQNLGINGTATFPEGHYNSVKITQSIPTLGVTTYTPKSTNQTITSGKYLTGIQTILGDANLLASNIISGKSIFGINGNVTIESMGGTILSGGTETITLTESESRMTIDLSSKGINPYIVWGSFTGGNYFINFRNNKTSNFTVICWDRYDSRYGVENSSTLSAIKIAEGDSSHKWSAKDYVVTWYAL